MQGDVQHAGQGCGYSNIGWNLDKAKRVLRPNWCDPECMGGFCHDPEYRLIWINHEHELVCCFHR